jgi:hypothetical protein
VRQRSLQVAAGAQVIGAGPLDVRQQVGVAVLVRAVRRLVQ